MDLDRLNEALTLRVKDLDFTRGEILVRDGKGRKDRRTVLPQSIQETLRRHLLQVQKLHERDLREGAVKNYPSRLIEQPDAGIPRWQLLNTNRNGFACRSAQSLFFLLRTIADR